MAEYTCSVCNERFDEEEKKLTKDENKCILHCEKKDVKNEELDILFCSKLMSFLQFRYIDSEGNLKMLSIKIKDLHFPYKSNYIHIFNNTMFDKLKS